MEEQRLKKEKALLILMVLCCVNLLLWFSVFAYIAAKVSHFEREISRVDNYQARSRSSALVHDDSRLVTLDQFANTTAELRNDLRRRESSLREELENLKESMEVVESRCSDTEMSYKEFMHFWEILAAKVCRCASLIHNFKPFIFVSSGVQRLIML